MLRKTPGFTAIAVLSLALGIGATSSMFSFADALLLQPLPVLEPDRVVAVHAVSSAAFGQATTLSYPDYLDFRAQNKCFSGMVAYATSTFGFSQNAALPRMRFGMYVSGNFFHDLGVEPSIGRGFRSDEDQVAGRDAVVVLSHDFWVNEFNSSPQVLGSLIRLNGVDHTVVGVAPQSFTGVDNFLRPSLFVPIAMSPRLSRRDNLNKREERWLTVKGRLRPGVSLSQAQSDIALIAKRLQTTYPASNRNQKVTVQTELGMRIQQNPPNAVMLSMLGLLSLCVLLVACANVAGLLLSRSRARSREIAVRLAIGASRLSLVRQLLVESLLLALAGGVAGIGVAFAGANYFSRIPIPSDLPIVVAVSVDRRALIFTLALTLISTLLFGLAPAYRSTQPDLVPALKAAHAGSAGKRRFWGRNSLVAGQVGLSFVLLVISAVLLKGFEAQLTQGPGYLTNHLVLLSFDTQLAHYSDDQNRKFYRDLLDQVRLTPGIRSAALASVVPLMGGDGVGIVPEGYVLPPGEDTLNVFDSYVGDGYFKTMDISITEGREILDTDTETTPLVAVVEEHVARHYWPGTQVIGKRFRLRGQSGPVVQIIGVAKTTKHLWIAEPPIDFVYLSCKQNPRSALTLIARSDAENAAIISPAIRNVIKKIDPEMPIYDARTMESLYTQRAVKISNLIVNTVAGMGMIGLVLAMIGLYGSMAYYVSRRTHDIGIRMAIGASRATVLRMVLLQGLLLSGIGVVFGLAIAIPSCNLLTSSMSFVAAFNTPSFLPFIAIAALLLTVTLLAAYSPARRASRIDPIRALRDE
jgi:predicted permease